MSEAPPRRVHEEGHEAEPLFTQLIVFDGDCPLCRRSVAWLLRHERRPTIGLVTLQSTLGHRLGDHFDESADQLDSVWLIRSGRLHRDSEALWRAAEALTAPFAGLAQLRRLPQPLRDGVYALIGRYRHRLARDPGLDEAVQARLLAGLSPAQCRALDLPEALAACV
ncbi:putative DCC family thiol-disulfide oxidoreductase YuxK [Kushneria sinocarnis]|uniref:Putative DCC family thiol-disulfide oxidoreductase YuxK n=1 Tax=Kushneria sinocarnis TaxID=595502 RepID=A0A420X0V6_9GAMM|nr:DUF393 domain-containing protein [Kushneria sinocarnis]RKR07380.1 putative DCC family thiol-disulfide oxidoreductase YuxK [Kushneria sinocarnis]